MKDDPNTTNSPVSIVFFGTPDLSAYILEQLIEFTKTSDKKYQIKAVVTSPDKPVGRQQRVLSTPVAVIAAKFGIPVLKPEKINDEFIDQNQGILGADLFVVAAYGKILPQKLLDIPRKGAINVHGSILPKYRGASPIQAALLNGDLVTGVTIMLMDAKMDHGPILSTREIRILEQDTYLTLSKKVSITGSKLLLESIPPFVEGKISPQLQNDEDATYTKLITKGNGYFDIEKPPSKEELDRQIRAFYPWPNVWTRWKSKIIKFYPGEVVQIEGKKPMPLEAFLHGYPDFPIKEL